MEILVTIKTSYSDAAIVLNENHKVIDAAPIYKWMIGKHFNKIQHWKNIREIYFHAFKERTN